MRTSRRLRVKELEKQRKAQRNKTVDYNCVIPIGEVRLVSPKILMSHAEVDEIVRGIVNEEFQRMNALLSRMFAG
jgi:hypothetical protein